MKFPTVPISIVLLSYLFIASVASSDAWAGSDNNCPLISGWWIAEETGQVTCEADGERATERESDSAPIKIKQKGCRISYDVPGTNASRSGNLEGNKLEMSGPFVLVPRGVSVSENVLRMEGKVKGYTRVNMKGKGRAEGEYQGIKITCTGNSVVTLSRENDLFLDLRTDTYRDQRIFSTGSIDPSTKSRPFRFWLNGDDDVALKDCEKRGVLDPKSFREKHGCDRLADEKNFRKDSADRVIDHIRDLEDFARLQLKTNKRVEQLLSHGYTLSLDVRGDLGMHFVPAVTTGLEYLTNSKTAESQRRQRFIDPSNLEKTKGFPGRVRALLYEGVKRGQGTLQAVLRTPGGTRVDSSNKVHVSLVPLREMYEEAVATPQSGFPAPYNTTSPYNPVSQAGPLEIGVRVKPLKHDRGIETSSYIIFVHGCCGSELGEKTSADTAFKRLWWVGHSGRFGNFRWPAISGEAWPAFLGDNSKLRYNESAFRTYKYAEALKRFIRQVESRFPGYSIVLYAHSQGNIVASEALLGGANVDAYVMSQAAAGADMYDTNEQLRTLLSAPAALRPAPYSATEGGPLGRFRFIDASVRDEIVNFVNPVDYALRLWDVNNASKPEQGVVAALGLGGQYVYEPNSTQATFLAISGVQNRQSYIVADGHEMLSFLGRSKTKAVGREERARGPIKRVVNLETRYGVGNSPRDHSAQFTRSIQYIYKYYEALAATAD